MKKIGVFIIISLSFFQSIAQQPTFILQKIDSLLSRTYNDTLPGISIAILQQGKTVFRKSYGIASITTRKKLSDSANFNICSLTKQFTAIAILQLEQKGLLSLKDKLSRFFPGMNKKIAEVITIQQLLTHTSGIPDHYSYINTTDMHHAHDSDVYNAIKSIDTTYFTPGTKFRYSNTGYCLLALIIEKVSGMRYNDYLVKNIFEPAGMKHTVVWNEHATISNEVTAYERDSMNNLVRSGAAEHIFFSTEGDGGIYTSVNDYIKWFDALQAGKVFNKVIVDKVRSIQFMIDKNKKVGYGFGWFVDEQGDQHKVYHSGDNGGFKTYSFSIPSLQYLVVIFSNRNDINVEQLVQQIVKMQFPSIKDLIPIEILTT
jgi:D-alanyl-D-alanine carboxypeptidase